MRRRPAKHLAGGGGSCGAVRPAAPTVRHLDRGVSGEDLGRAVSECLRAGVIWRRGEQRVLIQEVTKQMVTFKELSHGSASCRRLRRAFFLKTSRPER